MPPATPRRGLLAGLGTAGSLVAAVALAFVVVSGVVGFHGWASAGGSRAAVVVRAASAAGSHQSASGTPTSPRLRPAGSGIRSVPRPLHRRAASRPPAPTGGAVVGRVAQDAPASAAVAASAVGPSIPAAARQPEPAQPPPAPALDQAADVVHRAGSTAAQAVRDVTGPPVAAVGPAIGPVQEAGAAGTGAVQRAGDGLAQTVRGLGAG